MDESQATNPLVVEIDNRDFFSLKDSDLYKFDSDDSPISTDSENISLRDFDTETSDDEENDTANKGIEFGKSLAFWAATNTVHQNAVDELLSICRKEEWGGSLPKTCRTLLKTPKTVAVKSVKPGEYHHFGISNGLTRALNSIPIPQIPEFIKIFVNVDGLPIAKSSGSQFWPILGMVANIHYRKPFLIGLFHGNEKPSDSNDYLADFIAESKILMESGFRFKGKYLNFRILGFICDTPARTYILCVKGHSGYFGCGNCIQQGEYEGRVVFLETDSELRTDQSFRDRIHEDHHVGDSNLEELNIDMVVQFPDDPMHLKDLGINRKLLLTWIRGPLERRLPRLKYEAICSEMEAMSEYIPREFPRKTRSLKFIDRMKATEHGMFNSFVGPVVLANHLPKRLYNHFLVFHVIDRILSSNEFCRIDNDYASRLVKLFIEEAKNLYGVEWISYNVHSFIHLPDAVLRFGSFPNFSAYPFENYLQKLKRMLRKSEKPLQQVVKRLIELENVTNDTSKREFGVSFIAFRVEHDCGPLFPNIRRPLKQYKEMRFGSWFLSCKAPDNCVFLKNLTVIVIFNLIKGQDGDELMVGKRFRDQSDLYSYPTNSSRYNIFRVWGISDSLESWPFGNFKCKAVKLPILHDEDGTFAVFPLLMEAHN